MEELKNKILALLALNDNEGDDSWDKLEETMKQQDELIAELLVLARANNTFLGRIMKFQMADSYAMYVVTKVNKATVQLKWLRYCDAWVDDRIGKEGTVSMSYAKSVFDLKDYLDKSKNK